MPADVLTASSTTPWAAIVPLVAVVPAVYCMFDIARHPNTRQLSPVAWLAVCAFGNVVGLVAYLRFGRSADH